MLSLGNTHSNPKKYGINEENMNAFLNIISIVISSKIGRTGKKAIVVQIISLINLK